MIVVIFSLSSLVGVEWELLCANGVGRVRRGNWRGGFRKIMYGRGFWRGLGDSRIFGLMVVQMVD